ncbi:MAG: hypothetical protein IPM36_09855 [Lewinellaceae bacterium]|nr:hypothetical protein [Lewinellaceae bacterium]
MKTSCSSLVCIGLLPLLFFCNNTFGQSPGEKAYQKLKETGNTFYSIERAGIENDEASAASGGPDQLSRRAQCLLVLAHDDLENYRYEAAQGLMERLEGLLNPKDATHQRYLGDLYNLQAYNYDKRGYQSLSVECYLKAIRLYESAAQSDPAYGYAEVVMNKGNLVKLLAQQGKFAKATQLAIETQSHLSSITDTLRFGQLIALANNNMGFAKSMQALAYRHDMRPQKMTRLATECLELFKSNLPIAWRHERLRHYALALINVANLARMLGQYDTARVYVRTVTDSILLIIR